MDGVGDALLAAVRPESIKGQRLAAETLPAGSYRTNPAGIHLWMPLPQPWSRSALVSHVRGKGIGVASDAFATETPVPEAVRVCVGGPAD